MRRMSAWWRWLAQEHPFYWGVCVVAWCTLAGAAYALVWNFFT
jgi:hypothetical protein